MLFSTPQMLTRSLLFLAQSREAKTKRCECRDDAQNSRHGKDGLQRQRVGVNNLISIDGVEVRDRLDGLADSLDDLSFN
jgi:uncharacterized membrane protein